MMDLLDTTLVTWSQLLAYTVGIELGLKLMNDSRQCHKYVALKHNKVHCINKVAFQASSFSIQAFVKNYVRISISLMDCTTANGLGLVIKCFND